MPRAAGIILKNGSVALIERCREGSQYYVFPGGGMKKGESPQEAARREVLEELGLVVQIGRLIAEVFFDGQRQYFFLAEIVGGEFGAGTGEEMRGLKAHKGTYTPVWMPVSELLGYFVIPYGVARLVVNAAEHGWPSEALIIRGPM